MKLARFCATHTAVTTLLFVSLVSTGHNPSHAVSLASNGGLNVATDTDFFLPATATGDLCVGVRPLPSVFFGNVPGPVTCPARGKTKGGVPIATIGDGYLSVPKFPSPVTRSGLATNGIEIASAEWTSAGNNFLTRRADHEVLAFAALGDIAVAESKDPWFFSPTVTTELNLLIEIENVLLTVSDLGFDESGTAAFSSEGAFGIGDTPGENILAEWDFFQDLSTEGVIRIPTFTLFEDTFTLTPAETYWLTADVAATAVTSTVPEPSSILGLFSFGILGAASTLKRKLNPSKEKELEKVGQF